jgi:hypothetical protein
MEFPEVRTLRNSVASHIAETLPHFIGRTELDFARSLKERIHSEGKVFSTGWYSPPPDGICVLAAQDSDFGRLNFDSLRRQVNWPTTRVISADAVVIAYASPVLRKSLLIGDWGGTFYFGRKGEISNHISRCERIMRELAQGFSPGVPFSQIHQRAQTRFREERLNNATTVSDSDPSRTNLGHTVPFSFDYDLPQGFDPNNEDFRIRISTARRFLSATENLRVPKNGIFTFEARLIDESDTSLPNTLVHLMVVVEKGTVEVL